MFQVLTTLLTFLLMTASCQKKRPNASQPASQQNFQLALLIYADRVKDNTNTERPAQLREACFYALNIDAQHPLASDAHARLSAVRPFNPMPVNVETLQRAVEQEIPQVAPWLQNMRISHQDYPLLFGTEPAPAQLSNEHGSKGFTVALKDAQRLLELASMHLLEGRPSCPRNIDPEGLNE